MNRLFCFGLVIAFSLFGTTGCDSTVEKSDPGNGDSVALNQVQQLPPGSDTGLSNEMEATIGLEIYFNTKRENILEDIPCTQSTNVLAILKIAKDLEIIEFEYKGTEPDNVFVTSIAGVPNQLAGGDNWIYRVNGELGKTSCGAAQVWPGDKISWTFGDYPDE